MIKNLRKAMLSLMAVCASNAMAQEYSYEFQSKVFHTSGTQTLNEVKWTLDADTRYFGYDTGKGQQIGSAANAAKNITLTTSDLTGSIKSIIINTSGGKGCNAILTVSVGGATFGSPYSLTSTAADAKFSGEATGTIKLSYTQTSKKAIYIKSIQVIYGYGKIPERPTTETKRVSSIAEFNALPNGTETTLYLSDSINARVTYVHGKNAYLRDKTGAICFYNFSQASSMAYNQHVAGYITGKKSMLGKLPVLESTENTNTSFLLMAAPVAEENTAPQEITANQQAQNYANWVVIRDITMQDQTNGSDKTGNVRIVNSFNADYYFNPEANGKYTVSGIVNPSDDSVLVLTPIYNVASNRIGNPDANMTVEYLPITVASGIETPASHHTVNGTVIYDMLGRRIKPGHMKKGVYIVNGKKVIM